MGTVLVTEKAFAATVRAYAEALGWTVYWVWRSIHSPAGEPDLRLIRPPRVLFVELKSAKGKLTPAQEEARDLLMGCPGVEYYLWRPQDWPEIEKALACGNIGCGAQER